eukprot:794313_1
MLYNPTSGTIFNQAQTANSFIFLIHTFLSQNTYICNNVVRCQLDMSLLSRLPLSSLMGPVPYSTSLILPTLMVSSSLKTLSQNLYLSAMTILPSSPFNERTPLHC